MSETMDLFSAVEAGKDGMQRAADHADRVEPGWTSTALEALRREVRVRTEPFTVEQVRVVVDPLIPVPTDRRAWGAVTQTAIKHNVIVATGEFARAASSNGSRKMLYRRGTGA